MNDFHLKNRLSFFLALFVFTMFCVQVENTSLGQNSFSPADSYGPNTLKTKISEKTLKSAEDDASEPLKGEWFRRVYIPEGILSSMPTKGEAYWPVPAEEFEEWAAAYAPYVHHIRRLDSDVFVKNAVYRATFSENKFLKGTASFHVCRIQNEGVSASVSSVKRTPEEVLWRFLPVSFALENDLKVRPIPVHSYSIYDSNSYIPSAANSGSALNSGSAANSGSAVNSGSAESPDIAVNSGAVRDYTRRELHFLPGGLSEVSFHKEDFSGDAGAEAFFSWSQRSSNLENGAPVFYLNLISAANLELELNVPAPWIPQTEEGLVFPVSENSPRKPAAAELPAEKTSKTVPNGGVNGASNGASNGTPNGASNSGSNGGSSAESGSDSGSVPGMKKWRILLGGKHRLTLKFRPKDAPEPEPATVFASQKNIYQIRKEGLDVFVQMNLDAAAEDTKNPSAPVRELRLLLEKGLVLKNARFNETEISWRSSAAENGEMLLTLELPQALDGVGNRLELTALGDLDGWFSTGENTLRPLPRLRLLDVKRSEGKTDVQIFPPLEVMDFSLENASILVHHQKSASNQFQIQFQEFSDDAKMNVALSRVTAQLGADITTALDFQEHEIAAVTEILASVEGGECFEILGIVDRSWTVDSVESAAAGMVEDWNLDVLPANVHQALSDMDPTGALTQKLAAAGWDVESLGILKIQLAHSIRPNHAVSLRIKARRLGYSNNYVFTGIQLAPVFLPNCTLGNSWLLCGSSYTWKIHFMEPYHEQDIYWNAPEMGMEDAESRSNPEDKGIPVSVSTTLSEARRHFSERMTFLTGIQDFKNVPMLRLEHSAKTFSTDIRGVYDITSTPHAIYRIACTPQGAEIDRIHVMIRPGVLCGTTWKFPRALGECTAVCTKRSPLERLEDMNASFELWEITFRQPQREPFEFEVVLLTSASLDAKSLSDEKKRKKRPEITVVSENGASESSASENSTAESSAVENSTAENGKNGTSESTGSTVNYTAQDGEMEPAGRLMLEELNRLTPTEQPVWWRKNFPDGLRLPLVDVPDAQECTGSITFQNDVKDCVLVETREMVPALLSRSEIMEFLPGSASEDRSQFHYDPHSISNTIAPQLILRWCPQDVAVPMAWVWQKKCQSQYFEGGTVLHAVTLNIENIGVEEMSVTLEHSSDIKPEFLGIIVNGQRIPATSALLQSESGNASGNASGNTSGNTSEGVSENIPENVLKISGEKAGEKAGGNTGKNTGENTGEKSPENPELRTVFQRLRIPFPVWQRQNEVIIQWMENSPPLAVCSTLRPPKLSTNLMVLETSWQAWIPENYVPLKQFSVDGSWQRAELFSGNFDEARTNSDFSENFSQNSDANRSLKFNKNSNNFQKSRFSENDSGYSSSIVRDTLLLRLFGAMRLGKNIFSRPERLTPSSIESPIELDPRAIRTLTTCPWEEPESEVPLSHVAIFHRSASSYSNVGWNLCTQSELKPIFIVYGNVLESCRWFVLLVTCILSVWFFGNYRLFRVGLCGAAAASCMIVPLVWTPISSGIFLGLGSSFIYTSIRRHLQYTASKRKPVILVGKGTEKKNGSSKHMPPLENTSNSVSVKIPTEIPTETLEEIGTKIRIPSENAVKERGAEGTPNGEELPKNAPPGTDAEGEEDAGQKTKEVP